MVPGKVLMPAAELSSVRQFTRLEQLLLKPQLFGEGSLFGQLLPSYFRSAATFPNTGERCRLGLLPRFFGTVQIKL